MPSEPTTALGPELTARAALYTTALADEVRLLYRLDAGDHHADTGKAMDAYYDKHHYFARQAQHGQALYPNPQPAK